MENPYPRPVSGKKVATSSYVLMGVGILVILALLWPLRNRITDVPVSPPAPLVAEVAETPAVDDTETEVQQQAEAPEIVPPRFDVVRVDKLGAALIAGNAMPGAEVDIIGNDTVLGQTIAEPDGSFVAFLDIPKSDTPTVLRLSAKTEAADAVKGDDSFLVMPVVEGAADGPMIVAARETGAEVVQAPDPAAAASVIEDEPVAQTVEPVAQAAEPVAQTEEPVANPAPSEVETAEIATEPTPAPEGPIEVAELKEAAPRVEENVVVMAPLAEQPNAPTAAEGEPEAPGQVETTVETETVSAPQPDREQVATETEAVGQAPDTAVTTAQTSAPTPPPAPGAPAPVVEAPQIASLSLDTIEYGTQGEVFLAGRGTESEAVRVYVNNEPVQVGSVRDGTWRLSLPDVDAGIYTVRVDALDAQGDVTARVESPFKREFPEPGTLGKEVTIQPGYTLWQLAEIKYGSGDRFIQIYEANKDTIRNPDLIYPGQVFDLPEELDADGEN